MKKTLDKRDKLATQICKHYGSRPDARAEVVATLSALVFLSGRRVDKNQLGVFYCGNPQDCFIFDGRAITRF